MYLIYNHDGSIQFTQLDDYIMQNNDKVNILYVSVDERDTSNYVCNANFQLPDNSYVITAGIQTTFELDGKSYNGFKVVLTDMQTRLAGILKLSLSLISNNTVLYSYRTQFTINPTILDPTAPITNAEFKSYMAQLTSYQLAFVNSNVRSYTTLENANNDLPKLSNGQLVAVHDINSFTFYYKDNGILNRILQSSVYAIDQETFKIGPYTYDIPQAVSDLVNDEGYLTKTDTINRAIADSLGNVIAEYYLSKSDGATKSFVYNYAMPKSYAETYYYSKDGYLDLPPTTPADGVQFAKTFPIGQVLEEQVFVIERTLTAEYEFSKRNSSTSEIWIKSDEDVDGDLILLTMVQVIRPLGAVRIPVSLKANTLTKVIFSGNFATLGEQELKVNVGDKFYQSLSFSSDTELAKPTTISVISSITYPSSFSLDVQTQVIAINNIGEPKEMFVKSTDFVLNTGTEIYEAKILQRDHIQPIGNKYIVQGYIQETANTYRIVNLDYDVNANGDITVYSSVAENYRVLIASRVDLDTRAVLDLTNPTSLNGIDFDKYGALKITQTTPLTNLTLQTPQYPNIAYRVFISNSSVSTQPISVNNNLIAIGTGVQYYWAGEWTKGVIPTNANDIYDKAKSQTLDKSLVSLGTDIQEVSNKLPQYEKIETQDAISDFSIYTKPFIHIIYDIQQDNKVITQTLMPTANNQVVILEIQANGHTGIALQVQAAQGDQFAGTIVPSVFIENGVIGTAYPLNTHNWDFVACEKHIGGGIIVSDTTNAKNGVKSLVFQNAQLGTYADDDTKVDITAQTIINGTKSTSFLLETPLYIKPNPSVIGQSVLGIEQTAYEKQQADSYLSSLSSNVEIPTSSFNALTNRFVPSVIWLDNIKKESNAYITTDVYTKSFAVEETDGLDPNISGGEKYLISAHVDFGGVANNDCFITLFLRERNSNNYILDANGDPILISKDVKKGEPFGYLNFNKLYLAKNQVFMQLCVETNNGEIVEVEGSPYGNTELLIQQLKNGSVSSALSQYESDTSHGIQIGKIELNEIANTTYRFSQPFEEQTIPSGYEEKTADGFYFKTQSQVVAKLLNNEMSINGKLFEVGWLVDTYKSYALRGKSITATNIVLIPNNNFKVGLFNFVGTGLPTFPIITNVVGGVPTLANGWEFVSDTDLVASVSKQEQTTTFNIPNEANYLAFLIYPTESNVSVNIGLFTFNINVDMPFTEYYVKGESGASEKIYRYSNSYAKFLMRYEALGTQLRYTINKEPTKLPVGVKVAGNAPIDLIKDWTDSGFKGEGALKFNKRGNVEIHTEINTKYAENGASPLTMWYAKKNSDGTFSKITDSITTLTPKAIAQIMKLNTFTIDAAVGDILWLFGSTTINDGALLVKEIGTNTPLVNIDIYYKELI